MEPAATEAVTVAPVAETAPAALPKAAELPRLDIESGAHWDAAATAYDAGDSRAAISALATMPDVGPPAGASTISPDAMATLKGPEAPTATPATESPDVAAARQRVAEGNGSRADLDLLDKAKADAVTAKKSEKDAEALAEASKAYAEGKATSKQIALVRADTERRAKAAADEKRADYDELNAIIGRGETLSPEQDARKADYESQKATWESLSQRAEAGEELTEDEKTQLNEGKEVWGEKDGEVSEDEAVKLEQKYAELKAETDAMLLEKDPEKRAGMLAQVAEKNALLLGMGRTHEQAERDRKVIREVLGGKRENSLVTKEKSARNERMQKLMDQILGDAAELLVLTQQMEVLDQQREAIKTKIRSEKVRLGYNSTPMEKFLKVQTIIPLHRQLEDLDDKMVQIANGADVFASRYYRNILTLRSNQRIRGVFGRVADAVTLNTLAYSADIRRYSKSAARTLTEL